MRPSRFVNFATSFSALALLACGGPSAGQQTEVARDLLDQKNCVDENATRPEIDACRLRVKSRRFADSGVPQ